MASENLQTQEHVAGLIYAGGRGMRMGGVDKALIEYHGAPLIAHMSRALRNYASQVFITRQSDQADLQEFGHVLVDEEPDQGPLAGLVAALRASQGYRYLLTAAVDARSLPTDYFARLKASAQPHSMAKIGKDFYPTFALIDLNERQEIIQLYQNGERKLRAWARAENCGYAIFATGSLENINNE